MTKLIVEYHNGDKEFIEIDDKHALLNVETAICLGAKIIKAKSPSQGKTVVIAVSAIRSIRER